MKPSSQHVVIIGGGISGLSTAYFLKEEAKKVGTLLDCTVLEAGPYWGGKIRTNYVNGRIIEGGPDSFLTSKPWALKLCEQLGLGPQLINTNQTHSKTFTYSRGRLREFPQGLVAFLPTKLRPLFRNGLMSWPGVLRMAGDWFLPAPKGPQVDESLAVFFSRRLGREAFDRLIEPLVAGIYAGDADELSLAATFPRFRELEQKYGGLIKGMLAQRKGQPSVNSTGHSSRSLFVTLRGGLTDLVTNVVEQLVNQGVTMKVNTRVAGLKAQQGHPGHPRFVVALDDETTLTADGVVLATPAFVSAQLLTSVCTEAAQLLEQIPYASTATVSLVYEKADVGHLLNGFGFVVPRIEQKSLIAGTWSSMKWEGRANPEECLVRCYLGGRGRDAIFDLSDHEMISCVQRDLRTIVGIHEEPMYVEVYRWNQGMPQYVIGHLDRLKALSRAMEPYSGLYLTGAAFEGVGIPDCIRHANQTAVTMAMYLQGKTKIEVQ